MYRPPAFREDDPTQLRRIMREARLATLVTATDEGLMATPLPLFLDDREGTYGVLYGHVAKANPQCQKPAIGEALALFAGPDAYVSPSWYAAKQEHGKVVPTWNYAMAQVRGELIVHDDEKWVRGQAGKLTKMMEAPEPVPWKMADAPREYTAGMLADIVGIEIPIRSLAGKIKASQNRLLEDAAGAVAGLRNRGSDADLAMADLIERVRSTR